MQLTPLAKIKLLLNRRIQQIKNVCENKSLKYFLYMNVYFNLFMLDSKMYVILAPTAKCYRFQYYCTVVVLLYYCSTIALLYQFSGNQIILMRKYSMVANYRTIFYYMQRLFKLQIASIQFYKKFKCIMYIVEYIFRRRVPR